MPSARIRRSALIRFASSDGTTGVPGGYTRSARSQLRCRPTRPEIATSPRIMRNSSIWVTLRSLVHPDDGHGTVLVSGISRESRGPESPSRSRTSRRNWSFASSQLRERSCLGQVAMSAR